MSLSKLKNKISKFPQTPGVYVFKDKNGGILYVGKATNLRSRVGSYFRKNQGLNRPIEAMMYLVADVKTTETDSVLEALILESNLIKKLQPKYNVKEKDDKSFSYFVITKEKFPRVLILRKTDLYIVQRSDLSRPKRPKEGGPPRGIKVAKTYGPYASKKQMEIALKIIRRIFPFHSNKQPTEKGCLDFQLGRCPGPYAGEITREDYLKNIRGIKMILEGKKKSLVKKMEKEMHECAKAHKFEKAAEIRNKIFALKHIQDVALISREDSDAEIQNLKSQIPEKFKIQNSKFKILRIEAYDISNISGQHATGSMVVFKNNEPDKSQYRKFRIKTIAGSDDVGMMREVLLRRFKNDWSQPDLIFLDGGKGHLNMAEKLLRKLGFKIPIVAVAKGIGRKKLGIGRDSNLRMHPNSRIENILENKSLLKHIMSEAHRFAIGYHKKLRKNSLLS
jgi:excinuclease ABC subunit C